MRAWVFAEHGAPGDVLQLREVARPTPGPGQVLVEVAAAAINFADGLVIRGGYQAAPFLPAVAGMELSGRVVNGDAAPGALVAGVVSGVTGAFAEYAVMDADTCFVPPGSYSAIEAACFPVAYQTAWFALHVRGHVQAGDHVLVHAAAGGVGLAATQLAAAAGAHVVGVVGSEDKVPIARASGCEEVVLRGDPDLVAKLKEATGGGADLVVDPVGGDSHAVSERVVRFQGRILLVGFASGTIPRVRADLVMVKNVAVVGVHWGLYRKAAPDVLAAEYTRLVHAVDLANIAPHVSVVLPFENVLEGLSMVEEGRSTGRIAIAVKPEARSVGPSPSPEKVDSVATAAYRRDIDPTDQSVGIIEEST